MSVSGECDRCGITYGTLFRGGSLRLCHDCAHEMGLCHMHPDEPNAMHCLDGFASPDEIIAHLRKYREAEG